MYLNCVRRVLLFCTIQLLDSIPSTLAGRVRRPFRRGEPVAEQQQGGRAVDPRRRRHGRLLAQPAAHERLPAGPPVGHRAAGAAAVPDPADDEPLRGHQDAAAAAAAAAANATAANAPLPAAAATQPDGPAALLHRPGRPPAAAAAAEEDLGAAAAHQLRHSGRAGALHLAAAQAAVGTAAEALRRRQLRRRSLRQPAAAATALLRLPLRQVSLRPTAAHGTALRPLPAAGPNATAHQSLRRPVRRLHAVPANAPPPAKCLRRRAAATASSAGGGGALQAPRLHCDSTVEDGVGGRV